MKSLVSNTKLAKYKASRGAYSAQPVNYQQQGVQDNLFTTKEPLKQYSGFREPLKIQLIRVTEKNSTLIEKPMTLPSRVGPKQCRYHYKGGQCVTSKGTPTRLWRNPAQELLTQDISKDNSLQLYIVTRGCVSCNPKNSLPYAIYLVKR